MWPVRAWYTFTAKVRAIACRSSERRVDKSGSSRALIPCTKLSCFALVLSCLFLQPTVASERSVDEETELQEKMLKFGERPSLGAALLLQHQRKIEAALNARVELGAGALMVATAGEGTDGGGGGGKRRGGGRRGGVGGESIVDGGEGGGGGHDDLGVLDAADLDGAYAALNGGRDEGEDEAAGGEDGRVFDVAMGVGADGEAEFAADLDIHFEDDAGDAGDAVEIAGDHVQLDMGADEAEDAEAAFRGDDEDDGEDGVDVEGDEQDAGAVNARFAAVLAAAAGAGGDTAAVTSLAAGAGGAAGDKRPRDGAAAAEAGDGAEAASGAGAASAPGAAATSISGGAPVAKRPRVDGAGRYVDPTTALRERMLRLFVSHGGRVTMKIVSTEFKEELRAGGEDYRNMLMAVMKVLCRRTLAPDGKTLVYQLR